VAPCISRFRLSQGPPVRNFPPPILHWPDSAPTVTPRYRDSYASSLLTLLATRAHWPACLTCRACHGVPGRPLLLCRLARACAIWYRLTTRMATATVASHLFYQTSHTQSSNRPNQLSHPDHLLETACRVAPVQNSPSSVSPCVMSSRALFYVTMHSSTPLCHVGPLPEWHSLPHCLLSPDCRHF
jgi:hypothetical protein